MGIPRNKPTILVWGISALICAVLVYWTIDSLHWAPVVGFIAAILTIALALWLMLINYPGEK